MYSSKDLAPIKVAISLGMYIAERNEGIFKNHFMTFSDKPEIQEIVGDNILDKFSNIRSADWGYNTNIEATFRKILSTAVSNSLSNEQMPNMVLILSDMEFDAATERSSTSFENIKRLYADHNYDMPSLVFWNLDAKTPNFPVKQHESGTMMVSGFNPSILTSILGGQDYSPLQLMYDLLNSDRYSIIEY